MPAFSKNRWPAEGAVRVLLEYLDELHRESGQPSYREIGRAIGLAASTLSPFFTGARLVGKNNLELLVLYLNGDTQKAERLRKRAASEWNSRPRSSTAVVDVESVRGRASITRAGLSTTSTANARIVGTIPSIAHCFQRREAFQQLDTLLSPSGTVILSGLGGVGKTQIAADFAERICREGLVDVVIWITADSRDSILSGYSSAEAELVPTRANAPPLTGHSFLAWLRSTSERWLLVLDDLAEPRDLLGLWPRTTTGRVLVTTRRKDAAILNRGELLAVDVFSREAAVAYLAAKLTHRPEEVNALAEMAEDLGRLPLALAQAAAYIVDRGIDSATYRSRFFNRRRTLNDIFPEWGALPDDHHSTVAATWTLSIDVADQLKPVGLARPLLVALSLLDPNGVPLDIVTSPPILRFLAANSTDRDGLSRSVVEPDHANDAVASLARLNLVSITPTTTGGTSAVTMHALLQRATRENSEPDLVEAAADAAADSLIQYWQRVGRDPQMAWSFRANTTLLRLRAPTSLWRSYRSMLLLFVAQSLYEVGLVGDAADYVEQLARESAEQIGPDHRHTLAAWALLASYRSEIEGPECVIAEMLVLRDDYQRVFGADASETLGTKRDLANFMGAGGNITGAIQSMKELVDACERAYGADHPETVSARVDLIKWQERADGMADVVASIEKLLEQLRRALGDWHPQTLAVQHELALQRFKIGDSLKAAAEMEQVLAGRVRTLPPGHPEIFSTRQNVAFLKSKAGDSTGAEFAVDDLAGDILYAIYENVRHNGLQLPREAQDLLDDYIASLE